MAATLRQRRAGAATRRRSSCSTSTASRRSTTRSAIRSATGCCKACRQAAEGARSAAATCWRGSPATSSPSSCRRSPIPPMLAPLAERVLKLLSSPFRVDGHEIQVGCSIGPGGRARQRRRHRRADAQRRLRALPRQERGPPHLAVLRSEDGGGPGQPAHARGRPAARAGARPFPAPLPAADRARDRPHDRLRGDAALAPARARAWCRPPSSCRSPRRPAWSCRSANG